MEIDNLRRFGFDCYGHVPSQIELKAEWISNNVQCVFLGISLMMVNITNYLNSSNFQDLSFENSDF